MKIVVGLILLISTHRYCSPLYFLPEEKWSPLLTASRYGKTDEAQKLLNDHVDVNIESASGKSPLTLAARFGHIEVVRILISSGADIHHREHTGETALTLAAIEGNVEVVNILISSGATNTEITNALIAAAGQSQLEVVQTIVRRGANPNTANNYRVTPFTMAIHTGNSNIIRALREAENHQ